METNVFAQTSDEIETIIATVRRAAAEECQPGRCALAPMLDRCVQETVSDLWSSRVRTYVPLLALRRVRGCIRAGRCDTMEF